MYLSWGHVTVGEVDNANNVFVVRTQFLHMNYVPLLPEFSLLCIQGDAIVRRNKNTATASSNTNDTRVLSYSTVGAARTREIEQIKIPLIAKSVIAAYCRILACVLGLVWLALILVFISRPTFDNAIAPGLLGMLAAFLFMVPWVPSVRHPSYIRAVELALLANVDDAVMRRLHEAYGAYPECSIVRGLPISSSVVLYMYAENSVSNRQARNIKAKLTRLRKAHRWSLPELWPVDTQTCLNGQYSREVGMITGLPRVRSEAFYSDISLIAQSLAPLSKAMNNSFVVGLFDSQSNTNEDVFRIFLTAPSQASLRNSIENSAIARSHGPQMDAIIAGDPVQA